MNDRRILITCLIVLMASCIIIFCASIFGTGIYFLNSTSSDVFSTSEDRSNTKTGTETQPQVDSGATEATSIPENEVQNSSAQVSIDPYIARQMDEIQMQVILERGLKPSDQVTRILYSPEQLREKIIQDFFKDYSTEDARNEVLTLASFGLLEPDYDLHTLYTDLYSEQVAGFFDTDTKEMVVVLGEDFGGVERFVYAHEYSHVLQDQNFDLENGLNFNDEACETDSERCSAILALIEGDATVSQLNWFVNNATPDDKAELMKMMANETESPVFDSAPEFISLGLTFPYEYGYLFVDYLHSKGGWGTVDRAYQNPPLSTEQIIHPDRYPDDKPIPVSLPKFEDILGSGWEEIDRGVMGEWYTYLILAKGLDENARLDDDQAKLAVEGWGGDAYLVYYNEETGETVMVFRTTWDTSADADEFADSFRDYADDRFGTSSSDTWQGLDGFHMFKHQTETTTWIYAPDPEVTASIWQNLSP